jgi:hypothetical protein
MYEFNALKKLRHLLVQSPHFPDEETKTEEGVNNFPKFMNSVVG